MYKHMRLMFYRIAHNKAFFITYLILIPVVMGIAVYITNNLSYQMQIGIVGNIETGENKNVDYIPLDEIPKTSQMVLNEYDAVAYLENDSIQILSTKGDEYNQLVQLIINGQIDSLPNENSGGTASHILGFLMMVISLLGVQMYQYYFDERKGMNKRILGTACSCWQYLLSHFVVVLSFLFVPAFIIISLVLYLFHIPLSIDYGLFVFVLFLQCFFATSFGLWINVLSKTIEESMMIGNMFAIIGTIVSGGFVQVTDNVIFHTIVQIFPQQQIMSLLLALENQTSLPSIGIVYVIVVSFLFILTAVIIEKRKLPSR